MKITRSDYFAHEPSDKVPWLEKFFAQQAAQTPALQEKTAVTSVESARNRDTQGSFWDQMRALVGPHSGNKSHRTVESVVQDMQERTGLKDYLKRMSSESAPTKIASEEINPIENIFSDLNPQLKEKILNFVKNKISTHRGLVVVPAIQEDILSTFKRDGITSAQVNNEYVARYISDTIVAEQRLNPALPDQNIADLGKGVGIHDMSDEDDDNNNFFKGLMTDNG